ncbi:MAG: capsule assembly Wzi family protein, partial [Gemmatimonadota bacterium]|nr:capsule assembly Wzi family protein [Gemmatimonadota bacterium]
GSVHYTSRATPGTVRLATYGTVVFLPRGVPGLELGVARFFHVPYRANEPGADFWKKPFRVVFLKNEFAQGDSSGVDNQLASVFFRWVLPHSGFEFYGERGYEDQFYDTRDLILRPDHEREYMLGLQKVMNRRATSFDVFKAEIINYQYPSGTVYIHALLTQGHTNRGQLLGAPVGVESGAASTISWTRYQPTQRTTFTFKRIVRGEEGEYLTTGIVVPRNSDVIIAGGMERMRYGKRIDIGAKIEAMQDYNRDFLRDVPNLNLQLTARLRLP